MAVAVAAGWGEDADLSPWSLSLPPFLLVCAASGPHPPHPPPPASCPLPPLGAGVSVGQMWLRGSLCFHTHHNFGACL